MKLISMTDFVLENNNTTKPLLDTNWAKEFEIHYKKIVAYANFLKQPLGLWMFVPCDDEENVLEVPKPIIRDVENIIYQEHFKQYRKAKERCLFEGFEIVGIGEWTDDYILEIEDKNKNYFIYDDDDKNFQDADEIFFTNIEDLVKYNLQLTQTAIKQLRL